MKNRSMHNHKRTKPVHEKPEKDDYLVEIVKMKV